MYWFQNSSVDWLVWQVRLETVEAELDSGYRVPGFHLNTFLREKASGFLNFEPKEKELLLVRLCFMKVSTKWCVHLVS